MTTITPPRDVPAPPRAECQHCTVPTDGAGVCSFCAIYTPPETSSQQLDVLVNKIDLIRADGNKVLRGLTAEAGLFASVDLVAALGHLRQAAVLLDRATDQLEATGGRR